MVSTDSIKSRGWNTVPSAFSAALASGISLDRVAAVGIGRLGGGQSGGGQSGVDQPGVDQSGEHKRGPTDKEQGQQCTHAGKVGAGRGGDGAGSVGLENKVFHALEGRTLPRQKLRRQSCRPITVSNPIRRTQSTGEEDGPSQRSTQTFYS